MTEGIYLQDSGIDPYSGDIFHQSPISLMIFGMLQKDFTNWAMKILFIVVDLSTALLLAKTAKNYVDVLVNIKSYPLNILLTSLDCFLDSDVNNE